MSERLNVIYNRKPCYDILVEQGFDALWDEMVSLELANKKVAIITDSNVDLLYGNALFSLFEDHGLKVCKYVFEAGEASKTLDTTKNIYSFLIENNIERKDVLIALGGGVVGDITGFVAATYLRGVDFIQIPTTLLSQTDSSIGGKTGVDFDGYKNMVGSFKMPRLVYINLNTLETLDNRQYFAGFAEVMKHGLLGDVVFYEWLIENMYEICEKDTNVVTEMLVRSCNIKREIVQKDPTEKGVRALLNLGHTIGHAIEKAKNFELLHGECVALGTVAAAFISWKRGLLKMEEYYEIRDMFVPFYLPISVDGIDPKQILKYTKSDKKMQDDKIKMILLKKIGKAVIETDVTDQEILDAINEIYFSEEDAYA